MEALEISRSGLDVEWQRLQVIAENIANMSTTRTADGGVYQARRLVSGPVEAFSHVLSGAPGAAGHAPSQRGVTVYDVAVVNGATRQAYDPSHPHADQSGYVTLPAVSQAEEMSLMIQTTRSYEANLVAMAAAQQMYSAALQVGRQA
jgi:flagellar basal-body rod protein FlgC